MGNEILYCSNCRTRLLTADFERGTAFRIEGVASCDKCSADILKLLPPGKIQAAKARNETPPPEKAKEASNVRISPVTPRPSRAPIRRKVPGPVALGVIAGAAVLVCLIVLAVRRSDEPEPEAAAPPKAPLPARPLPPEVAAGMADLEKRVKAAVESREPGPALAMIQASRARHATPEWRAFIVRKDKELRDAAFSLCAALKEKALEAQRRGSPDEVKNLREQVAKVGVIELLADFDRALKAKEGAAPPEAGKLPRARIVRIDNPNPILSLAEVQVYSGGENIALKGTASQNSTYEDGEAARAIDGNTNGEWGGRSVTHTLADVPTSWWEVDLGKTVSIERVVVWSRTDKLEDRMKGYSVVLLDDARNPVATQKSEGYPDPSAAHVFGEAPAPRAPDSRR